MGKHQLGEICRVTSLAVTSPSFFIFRAGIGAREFSFFRNLGTLERLTHLIFSSTSVLMHVSKVGSHDSNIQEGESRGLWCEGLNILFSDLNHCRCSLQQFILSKHDFTCNDLFALAPGQCLK